MNMYNFVSVFFALFLSIGSSAILIQHDVPSSEYENFAMQPQFEGIGKIIFTDAKIAGWSNCTGTLIDPRTILTASHCLDKFNLGQKPQIPGFPFSTAIFTTNADTNDARALYYQILNARALPVSLDGVRDDIALIYLSRPIFRKEYLQASTERDSSRLIKRVQIAGYGATGTGVTARTISHKKMATNVHVNRWRLEAGKLKFGSLFIYSDPALLLGAAAPGDSGAPIIWEKNPGDFRIVAVVQYSFTDRNKYEPYLNQLYLNQKISFENFLEATQIDPKLYQGYGTTTWYTLLNGNMNFVKDGMASSLVESNATATLANPQNWSNSRDWINVQRRANIQPDTLINNTIRSDSLGARNEFFRVRVVSPVILDAKNVEVDLVELISPQSFLMIPAGHTLNTYRVNANTGIFEVQGEVRTEDFGAITGTLRGSGSISLVNPKEEANVLNNYDGTFDQVHSFQYNRGYSQLKLNGAYQHGKTALFIAAVGPLGISSLLHATKDVVLNGGILDLNVDPTIQSHLFSAAAPTNTLMLEIPDFDFQVPFLDETLMLWDSSASSSSSSMYSNMETERKEINRWTIIQSDMSLSGRFDSVVLPPNLASGSIEIEYHPNHVDVVQYE